MGSLQARFSLQGLDHHGVSLADQPGLVLKGKELSFYSVSHRPPVGVEDPLAVLKVQFTKALDDVRGDSELAGIHLYYLDADGRAIVSLPGRPVAPPALKLGGKYQPSVAIDTLHIDRRYEAVGKTGVRFRTKEEIRDVYTALEMFQTAYQMGWGGQFFARDQDARTSIFRHFDPVRSGLLRVKEELSNLVFVLQLFQESSGQDLIAYRAVRTTQESATLEEVLAWS